METSTIESPLILNYTPYGYKVNKPGDQSGEYVHKRIAVGLDRLLTSLTPGGSEFVNDPEECVKYVKEFEADQHRFIIELIKEKDRLVKQKCELLEAGKLMLERFEGLVGLGEIKDKVAVDAMLKAIKKATT